MLLLLFDYLAENGRRVIYQRMNICLFKRRERYRQKQLKLQQLNCSFSLLPTKTKTTTMSNRQRQIDRMHISIWSGRTVLTKVLGLLLHTHSAIYPCVRVCGALVKEASITIKKHELVCMLLLYSNHRIFNVCSDPSSSS